LTSEARHSIGDARRGSGRGPTRDAEQRELETRAWVHDIRIPISSACEALRLARGCESASGELANYLGVAVDCLARIDELLVDRLRACETPCAGTVTGRDVDGPVRVDDAVRSLIASEFRSTPGPRVAIHVRGRMGFERVGRRIVDHVFRNLIANAIRHGGRDDDLEIEVGMQARLEGSVYFVRDNGRGIGSDGGSPGDRNRGGWPAGRGTGVGLTIVESWLIEVGGWIECESVPGEGTTFYFAFSDPGRARGES